ncbi:hypothetical protein TELCIR_07822 [Teladorsagia circumcincta]|uniref:Uncharacterized protein n=1 Tax=Teladorsagia circumcincta TaxID=45464 RepID=A0A2G9UJK5_TELCI|nr:hypothetical protein TELCIR_07822 [Teladorsagia circumcincta]
MMASFSAVMNALIPYLAIHYGVNGVFIARFILGAGEVHNKRSGFGEFLAAMGATWCVLWMLFSSNSPDECRVMKMEERKFLKKNAGLSKEAGQVRSPPVPWKKIITNRAFMAHLISTWIITNLATVMMVYLPTYYKDVLLLGVIVGTMQEWNNLFLLTSLLCVVSGTVFSVFGSGDVQEFAKPSKDIVSVEFNSNLLSPLGAGSLRADSVSML